MNCFGSGFFVASGFLSLRGSGPQQLPRTVQLVSNPCRLLSFRVAHQHPQKDAPKPHAGAAPKKHLTGRTGERSLPKETQLGAVKDVVKGARALISYVGGAQKPLVTGIRHGGFALNSLGPSFP